VKVPFFIRNLTWKIIIRIAAGLLVVLFFLNLVFFIVEFLTNRHFSVLPFQEYSIGWRIGLTLFWLIFWLAVYRTLVRSQKKERKSKGGAL